MGDLRPGRVCLAQYPEDRAGTIAQLCSTDDGAQRLALLARAVASRLGCMEVDSAGGMAGL